jgi:hypothetical protein
MKSARRSDAVSWWQMGKTSKKRDMDVAKIASDIRDPVLRQLFLDGAAGKPRPQISRKAST